MATVTVSPKYQIVIPREIRESMRIRPGQKVELVEYNGRIELILVPEIREMRGFLRGMDTTIEREREDRI
jgi:AbrB family looped-hinge helix DNA binding protein